MPLKYLDAGTGKINGPSHTYGWDTGRGGNPGNDIQDVGTTNDPGTHDDLYARDDHIHEGVHSLNTLVGDVTLSEGDEILITEGGNNILITETAPAYGQFYYDAGECGEESSLLISCGPCFLGQQPIGPLVSGVNFNMGMLPLFGTFFVIIPGIYEIRWDMSIISAAEGDIKVTLYQGGLPTTIRSQCHADELQEMSAHTIRAAAFFDSLYLMLTYVPDQEHLPPLTVTINHLQFSAILIRRT